jgi:hypothetical protein
MKEQTSSVVYGLFIDLSFEGPFLLGLYFLEGEAEAARKDYIARQVEIARQRYEKSTVIKRLEVGVPASDWYSDGPQHCSAYSEPL